MKLISDLHPTILIPNGWFHAWITAGRHYISGPVIALVLWGQCYIALIICHMH